MSIGCIKNTNDLQNKRKEYAEYLQLMIDNESIKEKRIKDYKNPNKPPAVPPQYKTVAEQNKDLQLQEKQAIDNVKDLGLDISEARSFVIQLEQKQDGIDNLVKLNRNFPAFKKLVSEKLNPKYIEANGVLTLWEEFSVNLNAITGLNSVSTNSTNVYSSASDNYKKIPVQDDINGFIKFVNEDVFTDVELTISDSLKTSLNKNLSETSRLLLTIADVEKIDESLTPNEISQINKVAENLLSVYKIPTRNDLINKFDNIEKSLSQLDDNNSVKINDEITKDIVILNRFLSSFFNETLKKKITEYNKFIIDKITDISTGVKEEFEKATPTDVETPEIPTSGGVRKGSSKVDVVNYIMANKLYNTAKYDKTGVKTLYFPKIILDKYNKNTQTEEEIKAIISNISLTQLNSILRQIKNKEQRRETYNKDEENMMGEEDILSQEVNIDRIKESIGKEINEKFVKFYKMSFLNYSRKPEFYKLLSEEIYQIINKDTDSIRKKIFIELISAIDDEYEQTNDIEKFAEGVGVLYIYSEEVKKYMAEVVKDIKGSREPPPPPPINKKQIYDKFMGLKDKYGENDIYNLYMEIGDEIYKMPDSQMKTDLLILLQAISLDYNANGLLDDVIYNLLEVADKINFYKPINDLLIKISGRTPLKGPHKPEVKKSKEERIAELKTLKPKKVLQEEFKKVFEGLNKSAKKNIDTLIDEIIAYEYPTSGSGMKKGRCGGDLIHIDIGSHIGKNYKEAQGNGVSNPQARRITTGVNSQNTTDFGSSTPQENNNNVFGLGVKRQMKLFEKAKKEYQSGGDQPYIKSRIKIGSGVAVAEKEPTYQEFGKFVIHIPQLRKNILNFKYASGSRPQYLPIVNIDDDTKDLLVSTLETGKMSENQFNKLPQPSKDFLIKAIKGAGLQDKLFKGKDKLYATEEKEDRDRFNILKGEFDAGNDNPNLIKELRALVIKFIDIRIIPKKQGLEFLRQLN